MADVYSDFARVYDELMDNAPYGDWCENIAALIQEYGISRPVRGEGEVTPDDGAENCRSASGSPGAGSSQDAGGAPGEGGSQSANGAPGAESSQGIGGARGAESSQSVDGIRETGSVSKVRGGCSGGEADAGRQPRMTDPEALLASERDLVLDLGCGTGTLTELLCQKGYDMIGVDNSPQMLEIAMEKRGESGSGILYLLQDMRELELYSTVGTVISVCDSLNYLLEEEDLLQVFRLVDNYLYPGGLFIFDFNTVYKYSQVIGDAVIAENREDCSFIWENYYHEEEEINEYDLTVFVQEEGDRFRRFTENHFQRGYTPETMRRLVKQAGMRLIRLLDADTLGEVTDRSERVYVLARECRKVQEGID